MRPTRLTRGIILALALLGAIPAAADAATRYASPGGSGPAATCPSSNPCNIQVAIEDASVLPGDEVVLTPGTYSIGADELSAADQLLIRGESSASRPRIVATSPPGSALVIDGSAAGTVVRDIEIEGVDIPGGSYVVNLQGQATLERMRIISSGATGNSLLLQDSAGGSPSVLRDSFVWNRVVDPAMLVSSLAIIIGDNPAGGAELSIINSTVVDAGSPSAGAIVADASFGTTTTTVRNTIAISPTCDIEASGLAGTPVTINVDHSNFNLDPACENPPDGDIVPGAGNVSAAPLLVSLGAGDIRQRPGSPTIDAGSATGIGVFDLEGQPRIQGRAVDIGTDEATDPTTLLDLSNPEGRRERKRTIDVPAVCPLIRCGIAAAANLVLKGKNQASSSKVFKLANVELGLPAGQQGTLTFKLGKKLFKKLRRAKRAKLNVAATAIDPVGFTGSEEIGIKFKKAGGK